jgi:hypothetical protein
MRPRALGDEAETVRGTGGRKTARLPASLVVSGARCVGRKRTGARPLQLDVRHAPSTGA